MTAKTFEFDQDFDFGLGDEDAPITIVGYIAVTCPHCREFMTEVFPKLQAEFIDKNRANFVAREVYFNEAGLLAGAMLRAVPQDSYFPTLEKLFADQEIWLAGKDNSDIANSLVAYGVREDGDEEEITLYMEDFELEEQLIQHSQEHIAKDDVKGTPTLIVNGTTLTDWSFQSISEALEKELGAVASD